MHFNRTDVLEAHFCFTYRLGKIVDARLGHSKQIDRIFNRIYRNGYNAGWDLMIRLTKLTGGARYLTPNGKRIYLQLMRDYFG